MTQNLKLFEIFQEYSDPDQNQIVLVNWGLGDNSIQEQIKYGLNTYFDINGLDVALVDLTEINISELQKTYLKIELESKEYGCYLTFFVHPVSFILPPI